MFSGGLEIGYRLPAFCTSVGRAMLGQLDDADLAARLKAMNREALTPQTVTDPKALLARIVADRAQGYSLVDREAEPHFRSISVPVRRYDNVIVGGTSLKVSSTIRTAALACRVSTATAEPNATASSVTSTLLAPRLFGFALGSMTRSAAKNPLGIVTKRGPVGVGLLVLVASVKSVPNTAVPE